MTSDAEDPGLPPRVPRRAVLALLAASAAPALSGCAGTAAPAQWLVLRSDPGRALQAPGAPPATTGLRWLLLPLRLPEYLEREALLVPAAGGALQAWPGVRWAEPLREAASRVLMHDLDALLGAGRISTSTASAATSIAPGRLGVELLALDVAPDARSVQLQARWWSSTSGAPGTPGAPGTLGASATPSAPRWGRAGFSVPASGSGPAALAAAHREALALLAEAMAPGLR